MRTHLKMTAAVFLAASTLALTACGSDNSNDPPSSPAPSAADFPNVNGRSLDDILGSVGVSNKYVVTPAGAIYSPGDKRFGFGVFDVGGKPIEDADLAIYAQAPGSKKVIGPLPAKVESLHTDAAYVAKTTSQDPDAAKVVYVSQIPFQAAGEYRLGAVIKTADGQEVATRVAPSPVVKANSQIPNVGDKVPHIHTITAAEVGNDIASIDTRQPPDDMHKVDFADVVGKKPVALLFATPALCQSRVCGPVVDIAMQVEHEFDGKVDFIHQEIYANNKPPKLRPQVNAFALPTEPWLFVIGTDGRVSSRLEGAFSADEMRAAINKVLKQDS